MKKKFTLGRAARILAFSLAFCAVVLLSFPNSLAKFYNAFKGDSNASVAKFEIELVDVQNPTTEMSFNLLGECVTMETRSYAFSFTSSSDVALDYSVKFTFTTPPPANVRLWIDNESKAISCNGTNTVYTFSGYEYAIEEGAKTHTLYVAVDYVKDDKLIDFNAFNSSVSVDIIAEQKMPTT